MAHEVETMAFANETPWHGLGNRVDTTATVDDMLVAAGLDWQVKLHPTFAKIGDEMVRIPNKSALIRETDHKVLTTASDNWVPVQNRDVLEFFRDFAEAGKITLETAGSLRGGKVVWGLANIKQGFTTGNGRDAVKGYVLLASHHEMGKATLAQTTAIRVVCANTMAMALRDSANAYRQSHLKAFDFAKASEVVGMAREEMGAAEVRAHTLEGLTLSDFDTVKVLARHFQPEMKTDREIETLLNDVQQRNQSLHQVLLSVSQAPGAIPNNAWGLINGVTYWADHVTGRSVDARMTKSWFGENAKLKLAVEADLMAMAA